MNQYYYTIDEKYLKAEKKVEFGDYHKAKILLESILEEEPDYGKAHYQLGHIFRTALYEPDKAESHFKMAITYAPYFPQTYYDYLKLLRDYRPFEAMLQFATEALTKQYLCKCCIYAILAEASEEQLRLEDALGYYRQAELHMISCDDHNVPVNIDRVKRKITTGKSYSYTSR